MLDNWATCNISHDDELFEAESPQMALDDLYEIVGGPFQIRNTLGYYAEHTASHDGIFLVGQYERPRRGTSNRLLRLWRRWTDSSKDQNKIAILKSDRTLSYHILTDKAKEGSNRRILLHLWKWSLDCKLLLSSYDHNVVFLVRPQIQVCHSRPSFAKHYASTCSRCNCRIG